MANIIPIALLFILSAGYFSAVLDGAQLLTERDLSMFFIPPRLFWVDALKNWELPLWNPYYYSGHPLLAALQPGVFYPLNVLLLILPFDLAFNWTIVLHFFLAGVFSYMLLKELKTSGAAALAGSLTLMLSGYLFSVHNVMSTLFSVAWAPLAVFLFLRAARNGSFAYAVLTGLAFTAMFLGGGVEALFGTICLIAFIALVPSSLDIEWEGGCKGAGKRLILLLTALCVFLLVSAAQLLPFLELSRLTTRAVGLSYHEATVWSFDIKDFVQFFIPDPYGYGTTNEKYWSNQSWLKTVYTGAAPFILSAFFILRRRARALPFLFLSLASIAVSMGRNVSFYRCLYEYLPFFGKIRYPVKFLFVFFILLSVSTAFGFDILREEARRGKGGLKRPSYVLLVAAFMAAVAFGAVNYFDSGITAYLVKNGFDYPAYNYIGINLFNVKRELFFLTAIALAVCAWINSQRGKRVFPYAVVALLAVDMFFAHQGYYASTESGEYHKKGAVAGFISKDRSLFRVLVTPKTKGKQDWPPPGKDPYKKIPLKGMDLDKERLLGYNLEHRIFDVDGVDVMRRMEYSYIYGLLTERKRPDETNLMAMLNVKYIVSSPKIDSREFRLRKVIGADDKDMKRLEAENSIKIYENLNYLPRFYLVNDYAVMKNADEYTKKLLDKGFNPGKTVLLDEEPGIGLSGKKTGCKDVAVIFYGLNSVTLKTSCAGVSILVASESYYPGWKAYVDGAPRKLYKANLIQRGVLLPAGEHEVRFVYSPMSFWAGAFISSASILVILAWGVRRVVRRR